MPSMLLAKPKSHILAVQSSFMSILAGLRSLCKTCAECKYFIPQRIL